MKEEFLKYSSNGVDGTFYTTQKADSFNCLLNIVMGGRGIGKTTTLWNRALNESCFKNNEFVYIVRTNDLTKLSKDLILKYLKPEYVVKKNITVKKFADGCYIWFSNKDKRILGYNLSLSSYYKFKSRLNFEKVSFAFFDDAILLTSEYWKYLPNEPTLLLELISTIVRLRNNFKIFISGNNVDLFNPYFEYFKIPFFKDYYVDKKREIFCELPKNSPKLIELEKKTSFYKLVEGTQYGQYHYDNQLLIPNAKNITILKRTNDFKLYLRLIYNSYTLNIYLSNKNDLLYCEETKKVIKDSFSYILIENNEPNYFYSRQLRENGGYNLIFRNFYKNGIIYSGEKAYSLMCNLIEIA